MGAILSCLSNRKPFTKFSSEIEPICTANVFGAYPYITIFGHRIDRWLTGASSTAALLKISRAAPHSHTFQLFDRAVAFLDEDDRTSYAETWKETRTFDSDYHLYGTIPDLLQTAAENGAKGLGTLFVFSELAGWTGNEEKHSVDADYYVGHEWAGLLVKKNTPDKDGNDVWCFNVYDNAASFSLPCIGATSTVEEVSDFLYYYAGRRKLWGALQASGFNVGEINVSDDSITNQNQTCVINSWYWLYYASRQYGGLWEKNDDRMSQLDLKHLTSGSGLFDRYESLDSCPTSAADRETLTYISTDWK